MKIERSYITSYLITIVMFPYLSPFPRCLQLKYALTLTLRIGQGQMKIFPSAYTLFVIDGNNNTCHYSPFARFLLPKYI